MKDAIKKARLHRGLTQVQLAALLDVPQPRVSEWESGKHIPNAETIERIEEVLNVSFVVSFVAL